MHENQVYKENSEKDAVQAVKSLLEHILKELQEGSIPDKKEISDLDSSFKAYREACSAKRKIVTKAETQTQGISAKTEVNNTVIAADSTAMPSLKDEFFKSKENIALLKQLAFKKIIAEATLERLNEAIDYLTEQDIIARISLDIINGGLFYYGLTERGWKFLQEQETKKYLRDIDPSFLLPDKVCISSVNIDDQFYLRVGMIRELYVRNSISDYYVFRDYKYPSMLFGCAINNSDSIRYCYAGASGPIEDSQEMSRLNEIIGSDKVEELIIITNGADGVKQSGMQDELNRGSSEKMHYYNLAENIKSE